MHVFACACINWYYALITRNGNEIMSALEELEEYVRERIEKDTVTHARISEELKRSHPGVRGHSVRSIQRTSKLPQAVLELAVKNAV